MIRYASIAVAAAMLVAGAAQAAPSDDGETYSIRIPTGDLDLASPAGQETLHGRIGRAADVACGRSPVVPLSQAFRVESCRTSLIRMVQARVQLAMRAADTRFAGTR